jgi:hypothetical protein
MWRRANARVRHILSSKTRTGYLLGALIMAQTTLNIYAADQISKYVQFMFIPSFALGILSPDPSPVWVALFSALCWA